MTVFRRGQRFRKIGRKPASARAKNEYRRLGDGRAYATQMTSRRVRQIPAGTAGEGARPTVPDAKDNATADPMESRHASAAGPTPDDSGAANVTGKSNRFEMDYDEPTLPPSLPNLK